MENLTKTVQVIADIRTLRAVATHYFEERLPASCPEARGPELKDLFVMEVVMLAGKVISPEFLEIKLQRILMAIARDCVRCINVADLARLITGE